LIGNFIVIDWREWPYTGTAGESSCSAQENGWEDKSREWTT